MQKLVKFSFDYLIANPHFVTLLMDENVHRGTHIRNSKVLRDLRSPFVGLLAKTLKRGARAGVFRKGVDPMQFYVSLAGLCFFYLTNIHTLSELFGMDLHCRSAFARRRVHVLEFVFGYLRPRSSSPDSR
jgi:TetR/AcrR family transcriptional regulator